jgi:hypothetical protein
MFKNVASQKIAVFAFDTTTGAAKTGDAANITAYVNKDWAGVNVLGDTTATELDATNAKGWYLFDLTQAETNGDALLFSGKSSTANISVVGQLVFTLPPNATTLSIDSNGRVDLSKWLGSAVNALISGRVDANAQVVGDKTGYALTQAFPTNFSTLSIDASGRIDLGKWLGVAPAALSSQQVQAVVPSTTIVASVSGAVGSISGVTFPTNFSALVIDLNGRVDLSKWLGSAPNALISGRVDSNAQVIGDKTGFALTAAANLAIWQVSTSLMTGAGEIGKRIVDFLTGDSFALIGSPAGGTVGAALAAIKTDTGNIGGIKTKTDSLAFDGSGRVSSNVLAVHNVTLNGDGSTTPWGP